MIRSTKARRLLSILILLSFLLILHQEVATAATVTVPAPQRYFVSDIGYQQNVYKKDWYAELKWDPVGFPADAIESNINMGINEISYGTGNIIPDAIQILLPGTASSHGITEYSPDTLKHGTIYESYLRASYKYMDQGGQLTATSDKSNPARFLTTIYSSVELIPGTNNIKIKWDDVWNTSGRINYRILISDTEGFTQPPAIPDIIGSDVGKPGSPVTVNATEKKLEYTYPYALPGREYSIKVVPVVDNSIASVSQDEIDPISIKTDILLKASKVGYTSNGDVIWKLFWNPIVKGNTFARVDYELYRYTNNQSEPQLFRLIPDVDSYQITIAKNDTNNYSFKMDAKAYAQGSQIPVEFHSNNKVALKEQIPQQPAAPDISDSFPNADPDPLLYDDLLTPNSATVMWKAPMTGDAQVDRDVTYDIYLVEDISLVANPPGNLKIASDLTMGTANEIKDKLTGKVIGYKYSLATLKSNATYYFVIYAKKNFLVQNPQDGFMITTPYVSKQAVKVIITRPDTGTDRPVAPPSPPFGVKPGNTGVRFTEADLILLKKWHALYDEAKYKWEYVSKIDYEANQLLPAAQKRASMIFNYPPGWKITPHVVKYNDAINAITLRQTRTEPFIAYSDLSMPDVLAFEIDQTPVVIPDIPDDQDQTIPFTIEGLTHNTAYVVWVTIENQNGNSSDPSDPLVITTPPNIPEIPVTPTVPTDLKGIASDDFVDLTWSFKTDMDYEIKCGTVENLANATITKSVTYEELLETTSVRIDKLKPDTQYYFWIKAISKASNGITLESEYSNPLGLKTEAYRPPAPPTGFGVKAVTESTITYVWESKSGFTYDLEFADNINFANSTIRPASGGTQTVTGLISNRRYYARLYNTETRTGLRSVPSATIMVVTNKSKNEYDSSFDLDDLPSGDSLIIPPSAPNGVWTVSSVDVNAHRLAEEVRKLKSPIVQIDLSQPPSQTKTIRLNLGAAFIEALSEQRKELYVKLPSVMLTVKPGSIENDTYYKIKQGNPNFTVGFEINSPVPAYQIPSTLKALTPVTELKFSMNGTTSANNSFVKPVSVELPVANLSSYAASQVKAFNYDANKKSWTALDSRTSYINGTVRGEVLNPGAWMAATQGTPLGSNVPLNVTKSLAAIQTFFELKSLSGKTFNAQASINQKDVVKLLLDCVPTAYTDQDFIDKAVRSGLVQKTGDVASAFARRDQAMNLLVSLYQFKTHEKAIPENNNAWASYKDLNKSDTRYQNAVKFAIENGIIQGNGSNMAYPEKMVTYGDFVIMLERVLRLCGEL